MTEKQVKQFLSSCYWQRATKTIWQIEDIPASETPNKETLSLLRLTQREAQNHQGPGSY